MIFSRFALPLENREENDAFWAFARGASASAHAAQHRTCADAQGAPMRTLRSTAHAHMPTMRICVWSAQSTHSHIRHVEGALSAHTRIICAYALPRSMCAHARVRILCVRILCPHCNSGGGGSCRRQGKSAAPRGSACGARWVRLARGVLG